MGQKRVAPFRGHLGDVSEESWEAPSRPPEFWFKASTANFTGVMYLELSRSKNFYKYPIYE